MSARWPGRSVTTRSTPIRIARTTRSSARLFDRDTKIWLTGLYGLTLVLLLSAFLVADAAFPAIIGLLVAAGLFAWQIKVLDIDDGAQCLALFKSNNRVGLIIFLGLVL